MSFTVQQVPARGLKWELAQQIAGAARAPEQSLDAAFTGAILGFKSNAGIDIQEDVKQKIWSVVSRKRLKTLQDTLIQEFCNRILRGFNDKQIGEMLSEHKQKGKITNQGHALHINFTYALSKEAITDAVVQKAALMNEEIAADIAQVLKEEGLIDFDSNSKS